MFLGEVILKDGSELAKPQALSLVSATQVPVTHFKQFIKSSKVQNINTYLDCIFWRRGGGNLIIRVFQGVGNLNCTLDFM